MNEQKRRFLERNLQSSATATLIAVDSVVVGNLNGTGQFIVLGEVQGDGELGSLHLSDTGRWYGNVHARQASVAGTIHGALTVADKLEIGSTAVIRGSVSARTIAIAKGAIVDGEIEITSGTSLVQFAEKRDAR